MFTRTIGVEFEFGDRHLIQSDTVKEILKESIKENFNKKRITLKEGIRGNKKYWSFYDQETCGYEFRTPCLFSDLNTITNISKTAQHFYDKIGHDHISFTDCGLHVHLGIDDFSKKELFNLYKIFYMFENCIFELLKKERKKNICVVPLKKGVNIKSLILEKDEFEYNPYNLNKNTKLKKHELAVNIRSSSKKRAEHIEVRYCHGTLNYETIYNWILFLLFIVETCKENYISTTEIVKRKNIEDLISYIKKAEISNHFISTKRKQIIKWVGYRIKNREKD